MKLYRVRAVSVSNGHVYRERMYLNPQAVNAFKGAWNKHHTKVLVETAEVPEDMFVPYNRHVEQLAVRIHQATPEALAEFERQLLHLSAVLADAQVRLSPAARAAVNSIKATGGVVDTHVRVGG